ncbi:MAG: carboxymuconolactone decarboxylase family protein, partial [Gaiellaceae bacterium]
AHRPATFEGLGAFAEALTTESTLPPGLVHLTRVRVAQINGCPF